MGNDGLKQHDEQAMNTSFTHPCGGHICVHKSDCIEGGKERDLLHVRQWCVLGGL